MAITRVKFNITLTKYEQSNETGELVCVCPETVEFTGSFAECVKYLEEVKSEAEACGINDDLISVTSEFMQITYGTDDETFMDEFRINNAD